MPQPHRASTLSVASQLLAAFLLLHTTGLGAQNPIPETFTNLQVLPKETQRTELLGAMKGFTAALGVRCGYCHASKPGADPTSDRLDSLDFAADTREAKQTARVMMRMVKAINGEHLAQLPGPARITVACATCHRGVPEPEPVEAILARELAEHGAEAAAEAYRDLREEYYGSASYDFSEGPLNRLGQTLLESGDSAGALACLRLNAEFYPDSGRLAYLLGEAELAAGNREAARSAFTRAVELEPRNQRARQRLEELKTEPQQP